MEEFSAANRLNWDDRARLHATDPTGTYALPHVIAGGDALHAIEAAEIGDIAGKRLVHLQCDIGTDTVSLAHRGAIVTGLDFSAAAIEAVVGDVLEPGGFLYLAESHPNTLCGAY